MVQFTVILSVSVVLVPIHSRIVQNGQYMFVVAGVITRSVKHFYENLTTGSQALLWYLLVIIVNTHHVYPL